LKLPCQVEAQDPKKEKANDADILEKPAAGRALFRTVFPGSKLNVPFNRAEQYVQERGQCSDDAGWHLRKRIHVIVQAAEQRQSPVGEMRNSMMSLFAARLWDSRRIFSSFRVLITISYSKMFLSFETV
jgi:hypothetical protein